MAASFTTNPWLLLLLIGVACLAVAARRSSQPWADSFRLYLWLGVAIVLVRVLFAHWVTDEAELISEARVAPVDRGAALRLRALWTVIGPWERLIGGEALARAVRLAEQT